MTFSRALHSWLPIGIVTTIVIGLVYASVQQSYRQSANDPQIQIAEDVATALAVNGDISGVLPPRASDMEKTLAPYIIVYDETGKPVASSVMLQGKIPVPPAGVFEYTKKNTQDRLTWEPKPGVRSAVVVVYGMIDGKNHESGFILAGRSLREVEKREMTLTLFVVAAWLLAMILSFLAVKLEKTENSDVSLDFTN